MGLKLSYVLMTFLIMGATTVQAEQQIDRKKIVNPTSAYVNTMTQEQARQAILKMAGEFKVSFKFEEVYSTKKGYSVQPVDVSKANETVIVLENTPTKISLQHLLVMNKTVVKHWRQDWEYQPTTMWNYIGNYQWQKVALNADEAKGKWLQTVWQVDDSPRYASLGEWSSDHGVEAWTSNNTYRPLPRRELTTRDDYDTISGVNRQAITSDGWVHEQNNIKFDSKTQTPLARELGLNEYKRIDQNADQKIDFNPAYEYWEKNKAYWGVVRQAWDTAIQQSEVVGLTFTRQKDDDKQAHYIQFMNQAKKIETEKADIKKTEVEVKKLLNEQLTVGQVN